MAKSSKLKLPADVIGTLRALLQTPPPPKEKRKTARKSKKSGWKK